MHYCLKSARLSYSISNKSPFSLLKHAGTWIKCVKLKLSLSTQKWLLCFWSISKRSILKSLGTYIFWYLFIISFKQQEITIKNNKNKSNNKHFYFCIFFFFFFVLATVSSKQIVSEILVSKFWRGFTIRCFLTTILLDPSFEFPCLRKGKKW